MGGTNTCILCGITGHETKSCPNIQIARAAIKCDLCNFNGHLVDNCPGLAAAQTAIKSTLKPNPISNAQIIRHLFIDGPVLHFTNGDRVLDQGSFEIRPSPRAKNQYIAVFARGNDTKEIQLWSGQPGLVHRSPLLFQNSVDFQITYGTGMISRAGYYQPIPDHRGPVIHVVETDSNDEVTDVYVDVNDASATINLGWITDFVPYE